MSSLFLQLAASERRDALRVAAAVSGRPLHLLDKDVWLVWALNALFRAPFADQLVFKGGSSLSKAYGIIKRFSEDVDLTYDIRALAPDLVGSSIEPLPPNRSQESVGARRSERDCLFGSAARLCRRLGIRWPSNGSPL